VDIDLNVDSLIQRLLEGMLQFTKFPCNLRGLVCVGFVSLLSCHFCVVIARSCMLDAFNIVDVRYTFRHTDEMFDFFKYS
jgi:hypothetical protein